MRLRGGAPGRPEVAARLTRRATSPEAGSRVQPCANAAERYPPWTALEGQGPPEMFGIEDRRLTFLDGGYFLLYTAVSGDGFGVDSGGCG